MHLYSLSVYETPTHFYVIGSDVTKTRFNTLKIDRTSEKDFIVGEPDHDYSLADIGELLATVSCSSIVTSSEQWNKRKNHAHSLLRTVENAYGIIGAVRFLEGYYLLIVTKAKVVVNIGYHVIYNVEDVSMIYIPASGAPVYPDEQKYSKLFQSVDLTTNFYFSYDYDISRTLQENALAQKKLTWNKNNYYKGMVSEKKFVWNDFLLKPFRDNLVSNRWTLEIVHGYVGYNIVEIPCAKLLIALIARRSAVFAGTRFLKRGTNFDGAVANDVETEQIVWDISSTPDFATGKFASFVQRRGSVPLFWSQDPSNRGVVGKPPIYVDLIEPHALTTAAHFRELRRKYSHPTIVMNLVKRHEKRHNENILHDQFLKTVKYLNQFRSKGYCIDYFGFDVSRCNKSGQVLSKLEQLGVRALLAQGWFQSFPELKSRATRKHWLMEYFTPLHSSDQSMMLQHGISRTNCVDCLDRTNVAQFGIGKVALGFQLYSMGYIENPLIVLNTELCRILEDLYDEHGDILAWQYAGSQLVHSIKTYKKISVFQERSRDVFQTISRYYSNTFSDYEKQDGINLFLGVFRPLIHPRLGNDRYLHFPPAFQHQNEHLLWAINASSDSESDSERENNLNCDDIKIRAIRSLLPIQYKDNRTFTHTTKSCSVNDALNLTNDTQLKSSVTDEKPCGSSETLINKNSFCKDSLSLSLEDWLVIKTEEAGISLPLLNSNDLNPVFFKKANQKHIDSCAEKVIKTNDKIEVAVPNNIEKGLKKKLTDYDMHYRVFELTNFDQLLKDSPLTKKVISVDALNQNQVYPTSFIKLFKASDQLKKAPTTNVIYSNSNELKVVTTPDMSNNADNKISPNCDNNDFEKSEDALINLAQAVTGNDEDFIQIDEEKNNSLSKITTYALFQQIQDFQHFQALHRSSFTSFQAFASFHYQQQNSYQTQFQAQHHLQTQGQQPKVQTAAFPLNTIHNSQSLRQNSAVDIFKKRKSFSAINSLGNNVAYATKNFSGAAATSAPFLKLNLESGLKTTAEVYGFEITDPSEADMNKYRHYASMNNNAAKENTVNNNHTTEEEQSIIPSTAATQAILSRCKLAPLFEFCPSFFTIDSAFDTEINEVSESSLAVYRSRVMELKELALNDPGTKFQPSAASRQIYEEHNSPEQFP